MPHVVKRRALAANLHVHTQWVMQVTEMWHYSFAECAVYGVRCAASGEKVSLLEENDLVGNNLANSGVCLYVVGRQTC